MAEVLSFVGTQGSGKSTVLVNTLWGIDSALELAARYDDPQATPFLLYDATPEGTSAAFCEHTGTPDLYVLRNGTAVAKKGWVKRNPKATGKRLVKNISGFEKTYVDTSSRDPAQVNDLMKISDGVIVVTTPDEELDSIKDFLNRACKANPKMKLEQIVLNRVLRSSDHFRTYQAIKQAVTEAGADPIMYVSFIPKEERVRDNYERREVTYLRADDLASFYQEIANNILAKKRLPAKRLLDAL